MLDKPYFSFFGPAIRNYYYDEAYHNIADNSQGIPFEVVFSGNVPPKIKMPDNFRYIYCNESPAYCWELAARESRGDLLIPTADDLRLSKNFSNRVLFYTDIFDVNKTLLSFRYKPENNRQKDGPGKFFYDGRVLDVDDILQLEPGKIDSPTLGIGGVYKRSLWMKLGGLDRRFYGGCADIDLTLRLYYELGMNVFIIPDCVLIEMPLCDERLLRRSRTTIDFLFLLWFENGVFSKKRKLPVESFVI